MSAFTANGLPYPVGTDRVMDGDDAIRALAEALDAAWVVLTPLNAGWTARVGSLVPAYRVVAGVVFLRGQLQKATAIAQGDALFTLPVPARPSAIVGPAIGVSRGGGGASPAGRLDIATTGVVTVFSDTAGISNWVSLDGVTFSR